MSGGVSSALPRSERRLSLSCLRDVWAKRKLGVQTHIKAQIRSAPLSVVTSPPSPEVPLALPWFLKKKKKEKKTRKEKGHLVPCQKDRRQICVGKRLQRKKRSPCCSLHFNHHRTFWEKKTRCLCDCKLSEKKQQQHAMTLHFERPFRVYPPISISDFRNATPPLPFVTNILAFTWLIELIHYFPCYYYHYHFFLNVPPPPPLPFFLPLD